MKEIFRNHRFSPDALKLLREIVSVVLRYQAMGLRLTLRQLYYQLVTKNLIRNEERQYKRLSGLLSDARLMGLVDWDAIEDRIRQPRRHPEFDDLSNLVDAALASYRLNRWEGQKTYAELWIEKDAIAGVLSPVAREYHATLMVNRGYSSQSAMYDAAKRFLNACWGPLVLKQALEPLGEEKSTRDCYLLNRDKLGEALVRPVLLYLGDHDPSGEDMVRDIRDRLVMFGVSGIEVRKIALTMDQVEEYDPPPNPAKLTDPRSQEYVARHGDSSWEVDALPPEVLERLVREAFDGIIDLHALKRVTDREEKDKAALRKAVAQIMKGGRK
jgi:hypothetical protein